MAALAVLPPILPPNVTLERTRLPRHAADGGSRPIAVIARIPQNDPIADLVGLHQATRGAVARKRWNIVGWLVFCVVGLVGFAGLLLHAARMVLAGRGAETYRTAWLVEFNWIGVLVMAVAALVALVVALIVRWREDWKWRELERRYGTRDPSV